MRSWTILPCVCLSIAAVQGGEAQRTPRLLHLQESPATPSPVPSDAEIRKTLVERVDTHRQSVGIVVGVIEPGGRRIVAYGSRAKGDTRPLDGDTVFEIGSITKVFTSLLLADAVRRGEVALTDPVAKYLPPEVKMPERGGRAITLQDLATHTSGLPRMPDNFQPKDPANPYADYAVERMYQFLSRYQLTRDVGATVEYSNFGVGLLGHVLARRAGMDYDTLVRTRVTGPLGMRHTGIALSPEMQARLAPGHSPALEPVPNWDLPTFAGAGALRSSANDMLTFLAAALGYGSSPLDSAFATMLSTRRPPSSTAALDTALGWQIFKGKETEVIWHNGGTGGYRTWAGYEPRSRTGVVVLTNAGTPPVRTTSDATCSSRHLLCFRIFRRRRRRSRARRRRSMPPCSTATSAAISWRHRRCSRSPATATASSFSSPASLRSRSLPKARRTIF